MTEPADPAASTGPSGSDGPAGLVGGRWGTSAWGLGLASAALGAPLCAVVLWVARGFGNPVEPLLVGLFAGVVFGVTLGPLGARLNRRVQTATGDLTAAQLAEVKRSADRGRLPDDPGLHRAAIALARFRATAADRNRWWTVLIGVAFTVLYAVGGVAWSPWWFAAAAAAAGMTVLANLNPAQMHRRAQRLENQAAQQAAEQD